MKSLTMAPARHEPRALCTRTTSPSLMPRAFASAGLIAIASRPAILPGGSTPARNPSGCAAGGRLVGKEMQRKGLGVLAAEPFARLEPGRMRRTIVIGEPRDLGREELDPAGWRPQLVLPRIVPEVAEEDVGLAGGGNSQIARGPESVEGRQRHSLAPALWRQPRRYGGARRFVAALGEGISHAEAVRKFAEMAKSFRASPTGSTALYIAIVLVAPRAADVVALQRRGRRQHDIGVVGGRGPPRLVDDDGLRLLPAFHETS